MLHFEGDEAFPRPVADVTARLSDAGFLANCLPDAQVTAATPDRAVWKLRPKLTFVTGSLETTLTATARAADAVAFAVTTRAIGATSTVVTRLAFREAAGGTAVHWTGDLTEVTGLLKIVPKGLLQGTAEKVIADVWAAVRAKLAAG